MRKVKIMQYLFSMETMTFCEVSVYAKGPFVHVQCELFLISLTAPDECCPQIKKFKMKQTMETNPGYKVAVWGTKHNKHKILSMLFLTLKFNTCTVTLVLRLYVPAGMKRLSE